MAMMLAMVFYIVGCGQDESQVISPEEQLNMAPTNMMSIKSESDDKGSVGAVKVDLLVGGVGKSVGFVVFNTTADGRILANVHVQDGIPNSSFWAGLRVSYQGVEPEVTSKLDTNNEGMGNAHLEMQLPKDISNPVFAEVKLVGKEKYSTPFKWTPVPLKK